MGYLFLKRSNKNCRLATACRSNFAAKYRLGSVELNLGQFFLAIFAQFEQSFIDNFAKFIYLAKSGLLSVAALKTFGVKVYNLLFSFDKDPSMELYNFCFRLEENEINLRPILTKSLLEITKGYIDYMIQKNESIENLKEMISLIDCYMMVINKANMDYIELLSGELKKAKQERKTNNRKLSFHGLKTILAKKLEIELIDYYKQIPVACKAKIASLSDEIIEIDISTCSTKIFGIEKTVYIKSQIFPKPVKASIIKSDQKKETIQATDFEFTELPQEKRRFVRVQPKNPVEIRLKKIYQRPMDISPTSRLEEPVFTRPKFSICV